MTTTNFADLTLAEAKVVAAVFAEEVKHFGEYWEESAKDGKTVADYLEDDLRRFPQMIREEVNRKLARRTDVAGFQLS